MQLTDLIGDKRATLAFLGSVFYFPEEQDNYVDRGPVTVHECREAYLNNIWRGRTDLSLTFIQYWGRFIKYYWIYTANWNSTVVSRFKRI